MATISVGGAALGCDDEGSGPAVVLVHAGIADRRMWHPVAASLVATGHRVIRYDLRGYGESSLPDETFAHHDDLVAVLDALGLERAPIVGCSFGGAVAIDSALAHPDRVAGLVLVGSALSGNTWSAEFRETWAALLGDVDEEDLDAMAVAEVRFWVVGPDRSPEELDPGLLAFAREMDARALASEEMLDAVDVVELDPPASARLAEIGVPTWVLVGAHDVLDLRRLADRLAASIPGARRLPDVTSGAHLLPLERPEPVSTAIADFLRSL